MAILIKSIPTLRGEDAKRFTENEKKSREKRATVDFKEQAKICAAILSKAKI